MINRWRREDKKAKSIIRCVKKRKLKFENYKNFLEATQLGYSRNGENNKLLLKTQQRFKSERHNAFTEKLNRIALSSNDNKRMQSTDSIET